MEGATTPHREQTQAELERLHAGILRMIGEKRCREEEKEKARPTAKQRAPRPPAGSRVTV